MSRSNTVSASRSPVRIYAMCSLAVMTALTCVLAPLAIPIGPVPISLTNLVIYFSLYLLGWRLGTLSVWVYLLLGTFGLPVFSGFTGGIGKLLGPTGGYLIGFLPMALLGGMAIERFSSRLLHFAGLAVGTLVCYLFGTVWFCFVAEIAVVPALSLAVFPFLPGDAAKLLLAMWLGPMIRARLLRAGLLHTKSEAPQQSQE